MLVGCPFCRELFDKRERLTCPVCGVSLMAIEKLPRSPDALAEEGVELDPPEHRLVPPTFMGRGRGLLGLLALAGLAAFFAPWVRVTLPDVVDYSGFALGRRLGWVWAAGVAWFVLFPIVVSRRSIMQMRGARVAATFLAAIPGTTAAILLARPPHGHHGVPLRFAFGPGLYGSLALSSLAVAIALFFGGRVHPPPARRGTSENQHVH